MSVSTAGSESVDSLRREAETTRANLTDTVAALRLQVSDTAEHVRATVSPAAIKQQVKDYVRGSGENLMQSMQRQARENPLQAVALAAGLAYPALQLMRAIPAPLLLIGAGLALSRSDTVRQASADAMERVREVVSGTQGAADDAQASVQGLAERARDIGTSVRQRMSDTAQDAKDRITEGAASSFAQAKETVTAAGDRISTVAEQATERLTRTYDQNPLLIAALGMAAGALIASALPPSQTENRVFGDASEKVRQRALDQVADGLETAKQAASNVLDTAKREGLSAEGLSAATENLTSKVRAVAERGVEAALGQDKTTS
ncbi:MAG: hypothetical protein JO000_08890 [Alphaproteobacteria bacterium]|nr:hypothetical protein [Alphaproteobacteria bacterium]